MNTITTASINTNNTNRNMKNSNVIFDLALLLRGDEIKTMKQYRGAIQSQSQSIKGMNINLLNYTPDKYVPHFTGYKCKSC